MKGSQPSHASLIGLSQSTEGLSYKLQGELIRLGRKDGIELQLDGNGISRIHAQIRVADEGWELVDLKSTNGTFVNRRMVTSKLLAHGDYIQIGDVELRFEESDRTTLPKPPDSGEDQAYFLIGLTGHLDGKTYPLEKATITLGRLEDNDIVVDAKSVSGYHAEIKIDRGTYYLIDLNSTNGTYLNARKIEQEQIVAGDIIRINNYNFKVGSGDYKFAHTGTVISHKVEQDTVSPDTEVMKEIAEQQAHASYHNLKATSFLKPPELDEAVTAEVPPPQAPVEEGGSKKMLLVLGGVIVVLLLVIIFLLTRGGDEERARLPYEPGLHYAALDLPAADDDAEGLGHVGVIHRDNGQDDA